MAATIILNKAMKMNITLLFITSEATKNPREMIYIST